MDQPSVSNFSQLVRYGCIYFISEVNIHHFTENFKDTNKAFHYIDLFSLFYLWKMEAADVNLHHLLFKLIALWHYLMPNSIALIRHYLLGFGPNGYVREAQRLYQPPTIVIPLIESEADKVPLPDGPPIHPNTAWTYFWKFFAMHYIFKPVLLQTISYFWSYGIVSVCSRLHY